MIYFDEDTKTLKKYDENEKHNACQWKNSCPISSDNKKLNCLECNAYLSEKMTIDEALIWWNDFYKENKIVG